MFSFNLTKYKKSVIIYIEKGVGCVKIIDVLTLYHILDKKKDFMNYDISAQILLEYLEKSSDHDFPFDNTGEFLEDLLDNYFLLKNTNNGKVLEELMNNRNFNYNVSINNAIYKLLDNKNYSNTRIEKAKLWPGINDITTDNNKYNINTKFGNLTVYRASDIFKKSNSSYIFDRELSGQCYIRSYEFIRENKNDYKVVLSEQPYFFYDTYYHAYLEGKDHFLDIAANCCYDKKYSNILNVGRVIKKLTYDEIENEYEKIQKSDKSIDELTTHKLFNLILANDKNNIIKKINI